MFRHLIHEYSVGVNDGYKQLCEDVDSNNTSQGVATEILFMALDDRSVRIECNCRYNSDQEWREAFRFELTMHHGC
jgi:hypothetical protein